MKKRLAFVVQRYGLEVNGGAELLSRQVVEHLTDQYDVEVLTTKAIDYITWKNAYKNDVDEVNGVTVKRFPVEKPRNSSKFNQLSAQVIGVPHKEELEEEWFDSQGPLCPKLINYIEDNSEQYDVFIFMTYLYYTTVKGLPKVAKKSILIPTAHDEPPIYLKFFEKLFQMPAGIFYNTIEEKQFVEKTFHNQHILNNGGFGGAGVEVPDEIERRYLKFEKNIDNYMVYVGRIDEAKGCRQMFEFFTRFKNENPAQENLKLVLMGKPVIEIPQRDDIISLGFVSDEVKFNAIAGAQFLLMPSQFESLSMVVLEALTLGVPVLVNGKCDVLKGHCINSNAGLYYRNYYEFEGCVNYLMTHHREHTLMGENGIAYINQNYHWDIIIQKYCDMIEQVSEMEK